MKRLSVILASLVIFAGVTFAQQTGTMSSNGANTAGNKGMKGKGSSTSSTGTVTPVKKVPATKGAAKPAPAPQKASK